MLCSKCGREIPKGQEVSREGTVSGDSTWDMGGIMCKECAFPPFWKKGWFWIIVIIVALCVIGAIGSVFGGKSN